MDILTKPLLIIFVISATIKFTLDIIKFLSNKKKYLKKFYLSILKINKILNFYKKSDDYKKYKDFLKKNKLRINKQNYLYILSEYLDKCLQHKSTDEFFVEYKKVKQVQEYISSKHKSKSIISYISKYFHKIIIIIVILLWTLTFLKYFYNYKPVKLPKFNAKTDKLLSYNSSFGELLKSHYEYKNKYLNFKKTIVSKNKFRVNKKIDISSNLKINEIKELNQLDLFAKNHSKSHFKIDSEKYSNNIKNELAENVPFLKISNQ